MGISIALLLVSVLNAQSPPAPTQPEQQVTPSDAPAVAQPASVTAAPERAGPGTAAYDRPVSWKTLIPNLASDQKNMWLFPLRLFAGQNLIPTAAVIGTTAGLVALDPHDAPYFRRTTSFSGLNKVFAGNNTALGTLIVPLSIYGAGLLRHDSKMQKTALLAGEAIANVEILATVMKDIDMRTRPAAIPPNGNFADTWFEDHSHVLRSGGSFPSGHTIAVFSLATVIARRYGNHRWVPYVAYGLAGVVGFSRATLSAHFVSDVFVGGVLGYSISRFTVLRQ